MKQIILLICITINALPGFAQQPRAFTMPAIVGQVAYSNGVYKPVTLTGGDAILENDIIINPAAKTITSIAKEDYRFVAQRPYQVVHHSPNGRYRVILRYAVAKSGVFVWKKTDVDDWQVWGYSTDGEDWKFDLRNSDYPLGITNNGEVITTEPNVDYKFTKNDASHFLSLKVNSMKGIGLFNPKTGERKEITKDILYKNVKSELFIGMNQEGERITITYYANGLTQANTYNVHTGEHWNITLPTSSTIREIGNELALVDEFRLWEGKYTSVICVVNLKDGQELLSEPVGDSTAFGTDTWCHNLSLYGDDLYFLNKRNYSIARLKPVNGKMEMANITPLDTTSLLFKIVITTWPYWINISAFYPLI